MKNWIVAVALVGSGLGCAAASDAPSDGEQGQSSQAVSAQACHCKPAHCPKGAYCKMACELVGNCGSTCNVMMMCVEGYVFDEKACRCLPAGGGEACGTGTCGANQVCCNSSCGICTAPGDSCIQLYCGTETL